MPMKKILFICITSAFILSCNKKNKTEFFLPAEWEKQSAVIVGGLDDSASFEMVTQLAKEMKVFCLISDSTKELYTKRLSQSGVNLDSIHFLTSPTDFSYAQRDGIMFLKNEEAEKKLVVFNWNLYGWYFDPTIKDFIVKDKAKRELYNAVFTKAFPHPVLSSTMVNEGGAIETNGKGTILQVEAVNMQRNPTLSKEAQETELKKTLNAKKIIWLKEGMAEDPSGWGTLITQNYFGIGVKGHLDEFCRFVNANTILLAYPDSIEALNDPVKRITLERMKVNYDILKNATDQDGKPFTIIKIPVPDIKYMTFALDSLSKTDEIRFLSKQILYEQKQFSNGDTVHFVPSASYLNFLITNNTVFEAKYWKPGYPESSKLKDEKLKEILQHYFPKRKIYQIFTEKSNHNGGGLHCWSMQVPE
jgi:agmatine deiminase